MTEDERFDLIMTAVAHAKEAGMFVVGNTWGVGYTRGEDHWQFVSDRCCPLGALVVDRPYPEDRRLPGHAFCAAALLDVGVDFINGFTEGFDNPRLATPTEIGHGGYIRGRQLALRVREALYGAVVGGQADDR